MKIKILVIILIQFSCSGPYSDSENVKEICNNQFRKELGIILENKYMLIENNEFGIITLDSILRDEKRYNSEGVLTYHRDIYYLYEYGYENPYTVSIKEYNNNGTLVFDYDSTCYFTSGTNAPNGYSIEFQTYNAMGKMLNSYQSNDDSYTSSFKWINDTVNEYKYYDKSGNLLNHRQTTINTENLPVEERIFIGNLKSSGYKSCRLRKYYYNDGDLIERQGINLKSKDIEYRSLFKYDSTKNIIEELHYTAPAVLRKWLLSFKIPINKNDQDLILFARSTYKFDNYGNQIEYREFNYDGSLKRKRDTDYRYDRSGNILMESNIDNITVNSTYEYKYNRDGKRIKQICRINGELDYLREYVYNNQGHLVKETMYDENMQVERLFRNTYNELGLHISSESLHKLDGGGESKSRTVTVYNFSAN